MQLLEVVAIPAILSLLVALGLPCGCDRAPAKASAPLVSNCRVPGESGNNPPCVRVDQ